VIATADVVLGSSLAILAGLFVLSFFFSGTETAFFSLQELERRRIEDGETATDRRIQALLSRRTSLITTILMGNETVNVSISTTTAALVATLLPGRPWVTVIVVTPLLVLLSEVTPKVIAFRYGSRWVRFAAWPLTVVQWVLWLPRLVIDQIVGALARVFGVTAKVLEEGLHEDEVRVLVERGTAQGVLHEDQRDIIEAVFELDDIPVARLMTPRPDIVSLPLDTPWDDLLTACRDARYSRIPIWDEGPEDIVGVLLVKDLLRFRRRPLRDPSQLRDILLEPVFVPASKAANEMMKEMIRRRIHMAFVLDEHGTVVGLLSLDDLIMELVGELGDDDDDDETEDVVVGPDGSLRVRAALDLDDLADETGLDIQHDEAHTLGGAVFHELGRVPEVGDEVDLDGHMVVVEEMDGRRIHAVRILPTPLDDEPPREAEAT